MAARIELITGPMFSGKTDLLIKLIKAQSKKVVVVKYVGDSRYGDEQTLTSKSKMYIMPSAQVSIILRTTLTDIPDADVIFIDEGQFFPDIYEYCKNAIGKYIYISALNGNYKQELFGEIYKLFPMCDHIEHLTSRCSCGADAPFTYKFDQNECIVDIGGDAKYEPRCRECLYNK